jgi:hypothetical protein
MSAFGPKRTSVVAPHMSAFGGKADIRPVALARLLAAVTHGLFGLILIAADATEREHREW